VVHADRVAPETRPAKAGAEVMGIRK
jgi:hypothetical protein